MPDLLKFFSQDKFLEILAKFAKFNQPKTPFLVVSKILDIIQKVRKKH